MNKIEEAAAQYVKMNVNIVDVPHSVSSESLRKWAKKDFSEGASHILSNPSYFNLVSKEEYDNVVSEITRLQEKYDENGYDCPPLIKLQRMEQHIDSAIEQYKKFWLDSKEKADTLQYTLDETLAIKNSYGARILRQEQMIEWMKGEISRLHEQQWDVDWEIEADKAGLDKETQDNIIAMADKCIESSNNEKKRVEELEKKAEQYDTLQKQCDEMREALRDALEIIRNGEDMDFKDIVDRGLKAQQTLTNYEKGK